LVLDVLNVCLDDAIAVRQWGSVDHVGISVALAAIMWTEGTLTLEHLVRRSALEELNEVVGEVVRIELDELHAPHVLCIYPGGPPQAEDEFSPVCFDTDCCMVG
ncbi:MAG TPA: hypothetical protein VMR98_04325, partial [Candidatus Polarisedimenticolaceae bacterium]|nr:hypothetical protein [Candidatus Polarisedimenticolaceae bacterium]